MALQGPLQQRNKRLLTAFVFFVLILVIFATGFIVYPSPSQSPIGKFLYGNATKVAGASPSPTMSHTEASPVPPTATAVSTTGIGISDGSYAFDTHRANGESKIRASELLRQDNKQAALNLWKQAVTGDDTNDAETLIYIEDQRVLSSGQPYITLVVGTTLTNVKPDNTNSSFMSVGRDVLQGAYVAQREYNQANNGKQLRLLIANAGPLSDDATTVAQQIAQVAKNDPTLLGVMGWPFSQHALNVVNVLDKEKIPMVSPSASTDLLSDKSPYFFRAAPSNKSQAIEGAKYIEQVLHAKNVALFVDPNNSYCSTLANDFTTQFLADGNKIVDTEQYKVKDSQNKDTLPALLQKARAAKPDLIYFAGYAQDLSILLATDPNMQVMGGDALYELGGYDGAARVGFSHLQFTSFAYPDEWQVQGLQKHPFFTLFSQDFDPNHEHPEGSKYPYGYTRAPADAMLAYDATKALLLGYANAVNAGVAKVTPQDLQQGLTKIRGDQGFQGVTGQISFGSNGDPINKAIVILYVTGGGYITAYGVRRCFVFQKCDNTHG